MSFVRAGATKHKRVVEIHAARAEHGNAVVSFQAEELGVSLLAISALS